MDNAAAAVIGSAVVLVEVVGGEEGWVGLLQRGHTGVQAGHKISGSDESGLRDPVDERETF